MKIFNNINKISPAINFIKFKNPNCIDTATKFNLNEELNNQDKVAHPITRGNLYLNNNANEKKTSSNGLQLLTNLETKKKNWPGLFLLQKRGSNQANPSIVSYSFPGSKPKTSNLNCNNLTHEINYVNNSVSNLNRFFINNLYKILFTLFKSMYCLISKPVITTTQD